MTQTVSHIIILSYHSYMQWLHRLQRLHRENHTFIWKSDKSWTLSKRGSGHDYYSKL